MKFKKDAAMVKETLLGLDEDKLKCIQDELEKGYVSLSAHEVYQLMLFTNRSSSVKCADGKSYDITPDLVTIKQVTVTEHGMYGF